MPRDSIKKVGEYQLGSIGESVQMFRHLIDYGLSDRTYILFQRQDNTVFSLYYEGKLHVKNLEEYAKTIWLSKIMCKKWRMVYLSDKDQLTDQERYGLPLPIDQHNKIISETKSIT